MNDALDLHAVLRGVLREHARLRVDALSLQAEDDLYRVGMTSHACVNVMLALEDTFGVEFPDALLSRATFGCIRSIEDALRQLRAGT